jgi:hypothetical protein
MLLRRSAAPLAFLACLLASTAASADLASLWTFDQAGDPSPGLTGGALVGGAVSGDATRRQIGAGSYFGNNGSYVSAFGHRPDATKGWSLSVWVHSDSDTGSTDAICAWYPGANGVNGHVLRNNSGRVLFEVGSTGYQWSPTTVFNQQWHHLVLTSRTGGAPFTLYIDGVAIAAPTTSTVSPSNDFDQAFRIGANLRRFTSTASDWDGWIDDFGTIDRMLSSSEVALVHGLGKFGIGLAEFSGARALIAAPAGTVAIIAGKPWEAVGSGLPGAVGSVAGSLAAGDAAIVVSSGRGLRMLPAPSPSREFTSGPASLAATVGTGGTERLALQLGNPTPDAALRWTIAGPAGEMPTLAAIDANLDAALPAVTTSLAGLSAEAPGFTGGGTMSSPAYQGQGNRHEFRSDFGVLEFEIPLGEDPGVRSVSGGQGLSFTKVDHIQRSGPGYFVMSADIQSATQLRITGTADFSNHAAHSSSAPLTVHGIPWKVWIYRISTPQKPVIHHVFLTPPDPAIQGNVLNSPSEHFLFTGLPAQTRFHHLWFIRDFDVIDDAVLLETARTFLRHTHAPAPWLRFGAMAGSVPAGASGEIPIDFDSASLAPGDYPSRFAVIPAGTEVGEAPAARFHDARLRVLAPQFTATGPAAGLKLLAGIEHRAQKIRLSPVAGFSFGALSATSDAAWLRAIPAENRIGEIDLVFDTTGLAEGTHRARVTVRAGVTVQVVKIEIEIHKPEIRQILADPFRDRMYLLHEGSSHFVNSRVLVLKASDGTFIRELDVGRVYRIAQTPDGTRLYGLRQPDHAIVPVDLQRMLVEAPLALPAGVASDTTFSDLEAGGNGMLYFLNRAYAGKLHAYDTRTAKLLQTIDAPQDATAFFSRIKLSPDRKELWASQTVSDSFTGPFQILTRYAIGADGALSPLPALARRMLDLPGLSGNLEIVTGSGGDRVAISNMTFDPADPAMTPRFHLERIRAIAPEGEFFVGKEAVYSRDHLRTLRPMPTPLHLDAVAVSPEGHLFHASLGGYGFIDLIGTLGAAAAGFHESPGDGELTALPGEFRWLPVAGVREYRVHFARSADALAAATPAAGTVTRSTRHYRIDPPITPLDGETWFWRVDRLTPGGWVQGATRSFTTDAGLPSSKRVRSDVVKGCIAQPLDLGLPPGSTWQATGSDRPWLVLPASPGEPARIDSRLATATEDRATVTLVRNGSTVNLTVDLRVWPGDHLDLLADGVNGRVFALVSAPDERPGVIDQSGPDFVVRLDPATGNLLECFPTGRRARAMFLSPDGSRLAVEHSAQGNAQDPFAGGLEIFTVADGSRSLTLGSFSTYPAADKAGTAFGPGGRLMVPGMLIDEASGRILAKADRFTPDFSHFSPDGGSLYGADHNGIYRHDANSPTLARNREFLSREFGYDRLMMSADGSRIAWGTRVLDAELQLVTTTTQQIRDLELGGQLAVSTIGLHHLPSFRRILPLAEPPVYPVFCEAAGTVVHVTGTMGGDSNGPRYAAIPYRPLLELDAASIAPSPADGSLVLENTAALSWSELPAAAGFRVFFGSDRAAVEAATAGSPLELGLSATASWSAPLAVARGTSYFWKVIAEGPGGSSSSPVWSFATSSFTLGSSSFAPVSTINGPLARDEIALTAPAGTGWSLSSTTPWIRLPEPAGSGSATLKIEADPSGLTGREQEGSVTLTIEGRQVVLPVKFTTLFYRIRAVVADHDEPVMHALVIPSGFDITTSDAYLIRFDMSTQRALQVAALGLAINPNASNTFSLFVHPADQRVHAYHAQSSTLLSVRSGDYREMRRIDFSAFLPPGSSANHFAPTIAGRLIVTGPDRRTARLCDSATGARIADVPTGSSGSWAFFPKGSSAGSRVYATVGNLLSGSPLRSYDVFPDRVEAGPVATEFAGFNGFSGVSADGSTVYHLNGLYDRDLRLTGAPVTRITLVNRDASRIFHQPGTSAYRWISSDGTPLSPQVQFGNNSFHSDPEGKVVFAVGSSSTWLILPDPAILPAIPGAKWLGAGPGAWTAAAGGALRTPSLRNQGTSDISNGASLFATFPSAGTLAFQWRALGNPNDRFILRVNGSESAFVEPASGWQSRSLPVPAGAVVEWGFSSQGAADTAAAELRQMTFAPPASPLLAAVDDAADRDADGASDLLEAALGSDPDDGGDRPASGLVRTDGGWAFQFDRPAGLPFVYQVESSADLRDWDEHPTPPAVSPAGDRERVRVDVPAGTGRRFFRLRVSPAAP